MQNDLDSLMPDEKSEDVHTELVVMKCHVWNLLASILGPNEHVEFTKLVMEALLRSIQISEMYKLEPLGIVPYIEAHHHLCYYLKLTMKPMDSLKYGLQLEKAYNEYLAAAKGPPIDGKRLFFTNRGVQLPSDGFQLPQAHLETIYRSQLGAIYLFYDEMGDVENSIKYTAGGIKADIDFAKTDGGTEYLLEQLAYKLDLLLTEFRFNHLDYLLSLAMYHSVKYRRSLPAEERSKLNNLQGKLSLFFAQWGEAIFLGSYGIMQGNQPMFACSNPEFEKVPELEEPGADEYANQFPHDYTKSFSEVKTVHKRAFQWVKRAIGLCVENEDKRAAESLKLALDRDSVKVDELADKICSEK